MATMSFYILPNRQRISAGQTMSLQKHQVGLLAQLLNFHDMLFVFTTCNVMPHTLLHSKTRISCCLGEQNHADRFLHLLQCTMSA